MPSLRERTDDIPLLVRHFLEKSAAALQKKVPTPPKELYELLATYSFPGNVRELESMIHDAVSIHVAKMLSLDSFKLHITRAQENLKDITEGEPENSLPVIFGEKLPTIKQATRMLATEAMKRANGNQTLAANMLGISRQALSKRIKSSA